ncbi:hypothetical protein EV361DRAFT_916992 [Lentinula raphanica]|nr:hypothetical protein EV361DRAFT_916992 [Lentinula raphanica]
MTHVIDSLSPFLLSFAFVFLIRGISPKKGLLIFRASCFISSFFPHTSSHYLLFFAVCPVVIVSSSSSSLYMCILSLAYSLSFYFYITHPSFVLQPLPPIPILARGLDVRPSCSLLG